MLKENGKKLFRILIATLSAVIVTLFIVSFNGACRYSSNDSHISIDDGWTVLFSGIRLPAPEHISDFRIPSNINVGDTIIYERKMEGEPIPLPTTFRFRAYHAAVAVYVDDICYYSYGFDRYKEGKLVGCGVHLVNMPENLNGRTIRVVTLMAEKAAAKSFASIELLRSGGMTDYFARHSDSIAIGIFLTLFGLIAFVTGCIIVGFDRAFYRLILIGSFSFLMGLWTLNYAKGIQIFSLNFAMNTTFEYISLYLAAVPFGLLLINMRRGKIAVWKMNVLKGLVGFGIAFFSVTSLLHVTDIAHYPTFLMAYHVYIFVSFLFLFVFRVLYDRGAGLQEKFLTSGTVAFIVFALADLFRYNIRILLGLDKPFLNVTWIPIGMLLFNLLLMVGYLIYLYEEMKDKTEKDILRQIAYRDALTGIYNRAKCEQIFEVLNRDDSDYAIVSIDVNELKLVNDRYGHSMGDQFLCCFADVFKTAFNGIGTTIRMGGDEFVAIVRDGHLSDLNRALKTMVLLEGEANLPVELNVSYGYSVRRRGDAVTAMDVYRMADVNMYAMKLDFKQQKMM